MHRHSSCCVACCRSSAPARQSTLRENVNATLIALPASDLLPSSSAQITARDASGNSASASVKIGGAADGGGYEIPLPEGVDLDPVADHIDLLLELPISYYEEATQERRAQQLTAAAA